MSISFALSRFVGIEIRARGNAYFKNRKVRIEIAEPDLITASVAGSELYSVYLNLEGRELHVSCACAYADGGSICKHIWATILASEGKAFANRVVLAQPKSIILDEDDDDSEYWRESIHVGHLPSPQPPKPVLPPPPPPRPAWMYSLDELRRKLNAHSEDQKAAEFRPIFAVDIAESVRHEKLVLHVLVQQRLKSGAWGKPKDRALTSAETARLRDSNDRQLVALIEGTGTRDSYRYSYSSSKRTNTFQLNSLQLETLLPMLARTERLHLWKNQHHENLVPLAQDPGAAWELALPFEPHKTESGWSMSAVMQRGEEKLPLSAFDLIVPGIAIRLGTFAPFEDRGTFAWLTMFKRQGDIVIPMQQADDFVTHLMQIPKLPKLDIPKEMQYEEVEVPAQARLAIKAFERNSGQNLLQGDLSFDYAGEIVAAEKVGRGVLNREAKKLYLRDAAFEKAAVAEMDKRGFSEGWANTGKVKVLRSNLLSKVVRELTAIGWSVEADGKLYRKAGEFKIEVSSGVDWFDLNASADFDGEIVSLPVLLGALRKGENTIVLGDGNIGMLPEEWMEKYGLLAKLGTVEGDSVRFRKTQVGLLDALIATRPEVNFDQQFAKAREQLRKFDGIKPVEPHKSFRGELREYQKEGLGWMQFLRKFGFGGCLADDMGLGKTVQVLAYLAGKKTGTTLIVVPKSLVFNWKNEAEKFAPRLKVLDHTGTPRDRTGETFPQYDIVLTTYGILRNDATLFAELQFDTCILDESQAAKNADTETAKAVRLVRADHRLALSGTPIENHLGELWTLFEFLNPGMLGAASLFGSAGQARNPPAETRELLAKALRPYILRRTKGQVAKDLPEKTEQTVFCDLEPAQRKLYNELRDHYRATLLKKIDTVGLNRSKIQVLEALLRLRQAACHPGLIDKKRTGEDCAKLDVLLPQLREIVAEGHKLLVFSQFTSLLAIVKQRLDKEKIVYEYLDGKTNDRQARVERFQSDADCKVFLISLKAGGVGLNLTSAEYVFLLDPWWNPAAEAQAIDRTHRIGQTKPVFAYRLIAKDTVEEKVLALQETKRALAEAILGGEGSLISELKREDLELLLS